MELSEIIGTMGQLYLPTFTLGENSFQGETETELRLGWLAALALPLSAPFWPHGPRKGGWLANAKVPHSAQEAPCGGS